MPKAWLTWGCRRGIDVVNSWWLEFIKSMWYQLCKASNWENEEAFKLSFVLFHDRSKMVLPLVNRVNSKIVYRKTSNSLALQKALWCSLRQINIRSTQLVATVHTRILLIPSKIEVHWKCCDKWKCALTTKEISQSRYEILRSLGSLLN